jgi:hypothetical protein
LAEKRDKCVAEGGVFQPIGALQSLACVRKTKDGGKSCLKKTDCEAACLYVGARIQAGTEAVGQCALDDNPFGCRSFVENGKVVIGPCID